MSEKSWHIFASVVFVACLAIIIWKFGRKLIPQPAAAPTVLGDAIPDAPWGGPDYLTINRPVATFFHHMEPMPEIGSLPGG